MKFAFLACAMALALAGCGGDNTLQGATGYIYAQNPNPAPVEPPGGVYPNCKYGVYPPDAGMGQVCPPPAPN